MSFLFKSKKPGTGLTSASRKLTSADGSNASSYYSRQDTSITGSPSSIATNNSIMRRVQSPTPEPTNVQAEQSMLMSLRKTAASPQRPVNETSLYPWSQQRLDFVTAQSNPFPRYGAALNSVASREGDIYMMGGLINGVTVKGDLWIVEAGSGSLSCYPVQTTAEGPGARVGHASLLVGNAFIVFGGDTKQNESDPLDDTLYLLNTSTKHWSRALPPGHRPSGRYGHTLNILGSKIYVFGGQVEGYFFNDLVAFDLNALQQANSRWETLVQNSNDGGPPPGQIPPARTNHTIIMFNEKLYLFGGTDGARWFNDVWTYDPRTNAWTPQECIGFIPTAREGHAAALVGDVMYVFGGRTEEGKDLGDLAAFRIPTRRWYTFQNMGPSPSPRSGHGMTAFGDRIVVLAGEPSSTPRDPTELSLAYILDTTKIRYPNDQSSHRSMTTSRRPSTNERAQTPQGDRSGSRNGDYGPNGVRLIKQGSQESFGSTLEQSQRGVDGAPINGYIPNGNFQKPFRGAPSPSPVPSTPQQLSQPRTNGVKSGIEGPSSPRATTPKMDKPLRTESAASVYDATSPPTSLIQRDNVSATSPTSPSPNVLHGQYSRPRSPAQAITYAAMVPRENEVGAPPSHSDPTPSSVSQMSQTQRLPFENVNRGLTGISEITSPPAQEDVTQSYTKQAKVADSGLGSSPAIHNRNDEMLRELEAARSKNAWYASELALARKAGYRAGADESPMLDERTAEAFGDEEKPLLEALLRMRAELVKVQDSLASQSAAAAEKIAQVSKERDAAVAEATYSRTRLAAYGWRGASQSDDSRDAGTPDTERSEDANRRLASALAAQSELSSRMQSLSKQLESERRARQQAEESADVAHGRASELDSYKQGSTAELERLRSELLEAQRTAREEAANSAEALVSSKMLQVDKNELTGKLTAAQETARTHDSVLTSLRDAVNASADKASLLERKLDYEKRLRSSLDEKLAKLRADHETRVAELETTTARLRDAEELAESHAAEARTHRGAVLAGLGHRTERELDTAAANDERVNILQQRLDAANAMVRRNQDAADRAAERLRRAEERIAGLETYQEQTSREGLNFRKQLQAASREALSLRSENADLQQQLASEKLDSTALQVQHSALKGLLSERGIDSSDLQKGKILTGSSLANAERLRELEEQLDASVKAHEEMRTSFEQREQEANRGWEDKLATLDNDYQSAVKYLKGTEKMLSKMKQELHRYKSQNKELEDELTVERKNNAGLRDAPADWDHERTLLRKDIEELQSRVQQSTVQLETQMKELRDARDSNHRFQQDLERNRGDVQNLKSHNGMLEARAAEAERKVQMLLDTVGTTVGHYRRESQQQQLQQLQANGHAHARGMSYGSSGGESVYSVGGDGTADGNNGNQGRFDMSGVPVSALSRNSVALDSLASELETLRSHWETTSKNYRLSERSEFGGAAAPAVAAKTPGGEASAAPLNSSLASWRKKLELEERGPEENGGTE